MSGKHSKTIYIPDSESGSHRPTTLPWPAEIKDSRNFR